MIGSERTDVKFSYNHSCISVEEIVVGGAKDLFYVHIHTTVIGPMEVRNAPLEEIVCPTSYWF